MIADLDLSLFQGHGINEQVAAVKFSCFVSIYAIAGSFLKAPNEIGIWKGLWCFNSYIIYYM